MKTYNYMFDRMMMQRIEYVASAATRGKLCRDFGKILPVELVEHGGVVQIPRFRRKIFNKNSDVFTQTR